MMQKKKIKVYLVFVLVLFVFVLYFSFKDNYLEIIEALSGVKVIYLLLGILYVFISKYLIGVITYYLAIKEKKNSKFSKMLQIALIYPFFAGITPSSVGGEAFEVFYLKKTGIDYGKSSNISIQKFILYQISLIIVNFMAVLLNLFTDIVADTSLVGSSVALNFVVNIVILLFFFLVSKKSLVMALIREIVPNIFRKNGMLVVAVYSTFVSFSCVSTSFASILSCVSNSLELELARMISFLNIIIRTIMIIIVNK